MARAGTDGKRILVVDDDARLHEGIRDFLEPNGYGIYSLFAGGPAVQEMQKIGVDLVLLDVMLPGGSDGFSVLEEIREHAPTPVLTLTARGEQTDRVVGLGLRADDYLSKPFSLRELLARIKAVLRRSGEDGMGALAAQTVTGGVAAGNFFLDDKRHILRWKDRTLALSTSEVRILHAFMQYSGEVLSRDRILSLAFGAERCAGDRNIDVHISRVRGLLRSLDPSLCPIRTVWGTGYVRNEAV